jgi:AraC-like DNA-binding protein
MFVEALRRYLEALPPNQTGWLAGLRDPVVGQALAAIHARPTDAWTVEGLAQLVGVSRSVLAERFTEMVGQPPMQYLALWRMQPASRLLVSRPRDSQHKSRAGHPASLRCSSLTNSRFARFSRLAIRAPRSGTYVTNHAAGTLAGCCSTAIEHGYSARRHGERRGARPPPAHLHGAQHATQRPSGSASAPGCTPRR